MIMSLQLAPNIFDNIDALNLTKRQRGPILGRLKEFLERSRSRVALVLRGWEKRKWSQKSMRKLERELLTEFTYRPLACDMLRILRKACNAWAMQNDP